MRGIANQARFLLEDHGERLEPDAHRRLERMQDLCSHLEGLIATLLKYSRIGKSDARENVDPAMVIEHVKASLSEMRTERNATITVQSPMPAVQANPADVATVLQNLIVNGLTYNDSEEKRITVGFRSRVLVNGTLLQNAYFVQDNGIGINDEFYEDVFRMFKRLHQTDAYGEGSGAGLTFIKRVLENSGGEIQLTSAPGQGSTFYFTFSQTAVDKTSAHIAGQASTQHA